MPRKRQISSSPEIEEEEEDDLSDVPSDSGVDIEEDVDAVPEEEDEEMGLDEEEEEQDEEEDGEQEEEVEDEEDEVEDEDEEQEVEEEEEEEEEEEDEDDNADDDEDFEQQSEDEAEAVSSDEDPDSDETPIPQPTITTTSKGRISRKPIPIQKPVAPPVTTRPARSTTRAEPPPEPPKIKLKLSLAKDHPRPVQQEAMEEIKVENPPRELKKEAKLVVPKIPEKAKGKQPEVVPVVEDEDEESESSVLEEDEEDLSAMDEDDIPGGTEMDMDDEEEEEEEDEEEDEEDEEEDEETERSRTGTPLDSSRLTKRQQAKFNESLRPHSLMSLPNGTFPPTYPPPLFPMLTFPIAETLRKRPLTADEIALRRSETARRRKNQSEQRLEEEKIETINRLLKPQAPRRRGGQRLRDDSPGPSDTDLLPRETTPPLPATKVRIVKTAGGTVVAVPEKWLGMFEWGKRGGGAVVVRKREGCAECGREGVYAVGEGKRACSLQCYKALKA